MGPEPVEYCRQIEVYLCRKNDGHLIRVVGPSFETVSRWATEGIPLKVAFSGIDRYFERYYSKGPRRRPVRIDFCEADILDVFDEWRRAIGLPRSASAASGLPGIDRSQDDDVSTQAGSDGSQPDTKRPDSSLPAHLGRAVMRLTDARTRGTLGPEADPLIDHVAHELDLARASARGLRGELRRALIERLAQFDADLLRIARDALSESERRACEKEAEEELEAFRERLGGEGYRRAQAAAIDRLVRERFGLPVLSYA